MKELKKQTKLLDYETNQIQELVKKRKWNELNDFEKILKTYNFVRDEIEFGYNVSDNIKASKVLKDGYGQCNTKATLLMALLRAVDIPCRFHGFTIYKELQKGAITGLWYKLAPKEIVHSWVEVLYKGKWYNLEGFIIDSKYLSALQATQKDDSGAFCGFGVATNDFKNPQIDWNVNHTYIQKEGINQDFGIFNDPDSFFRYHSQKFNKIKKFLFENYARHAMNKNVAKIRDSK